MKKEQKQVKVGDKVSAIFRKYGKHYIRGEVFEVSTDEHGLNGTWVSIRVTGGKDMSDKQVLRMAMNKINVMVPVSDVLEVL